MLGLRLGEGLGLEEGLGLGEELELEDGPACRKVAISHTASGGKAMASVSSIYTTIYLNATIE